jgi:hypothetical protein
MLTVSVPKLRFRDSRTTEVRPSRLQAWLEELPQGDQEDSMQQIVQALFVQNRTALEPTNRLELMELYRVPVFNIAESLAQHYVTSPFPMGKSQSMLASSVVRLFEELANGYKIVANDLITSDVTKRHKQAFALALQRATYTLSTIFLKCCEIYRPYPHEAWHQLYQLYRLAEAKEILQHPVEKLNPGGDAETVLSSFERGFLIGVSSPYELLQGECAQLFGLIPGWRGRIRVSPWSGRGKEDSPGNFLVNLASDSPPIPLAKLAKVGDGSKSNHCRLVSTLDVIKEVHSIMTALNTSIPDTLPVAGGVGISTNAGLLRRFGRTLAGVNVVRQASRSSYDHEAPICIGMNSIHFFVNGQRTFQVTEKNEQDVPATHGAANEELFDLSDPLVGDVHDPRARQPGSPGLAMYGNSHRLFTCSLKDQGAPGLCVRTREHNGLQVRVGDLVGLQFPTPNQWSVGVVRWLRGHAASSLDFGVELLAPAFHPVAVKRQVAGDKFFQALLLPGSRSLKQPQSLLVPRGAYQAAEKLTLTDQQGEQYEVSPLRVLERTGSYDQLLVALPGLRNLPVS